MSSLTLAPSHNTAPVIDRPAKGAAGSVFAPVAAIFSRVRRFGKRMGEVQARGLMSGFYYVVLGPFSLIGAKRRRRDAEQAIAPAWQAVVYRRAADHYHQQY